MTHKDILLSNSPPHINLKVSNPHVQLIGEREILAYSLMEVVALIQIRSSIESRDKIFFNSKTFSFSNSTVVG